MDLRLEGICAEIRSSLEEAVRRAISEDSALLLSGGLDTSIIAFIARSYSRPTAFTVALEGGLAPDVEYASLVAQQLSLNHEVRYFSEKDIGESIPSVIRTLRTFDPMEVRNSLAIHICMGAAKKRGFRAVVCGDGSDELFAGYAFALSLTPEQLDAELKRLWSVMTFSSIRLAESLGIEARLPFLDPEFKALAMKIHPKHKVGRRGGRLYGKWILRKAYENLLPDEIIWRPKTPIEYGTGTTALTRIFESSMSPEDFKEAALKVKEVDGVTLRNAEHLQYYQIFRALFGPPKPPASGRACPFCRGAVNGETRFCRTCGAYPV
uniref:Asparagine synthetase domain-containing protein n=1 Tax=Candidatus Methanomethylicus mesodigestus TaxID=1867258 RepID=A0A7C3FDC4_9CREN